MTDRHPDETRPEPSLRSAGELLGDIATDLTTLLRQEVDLAKAEVRESADHAKAGASMFGGAAVAGLLALIFLTVALWWALAELIGGGWSALVVGLAWAVVAAVLAVVGRNRMRRVDPVPHRTVETSRSIPDALRGHETA